MTWTSVWLILAVAAAIIEIATPSFGFIFATVGALCAAGAAGFGVPLLGQLPIFTVVLLLCLVLLRPRLVRRLAGSPGIPDRIDRLIGERGEVTEAIDGARGQGRVVLGGEDWAARSEHNLAAGTPVVVQGADGIVLRVAPAPSDR